MSLKEIGFLPINCEKEKEHHRTCMLRGEKRSVNHHTLRRNIRSPMSAPHFSVNFCTYPSSLSQKKFEFLHWKIDFSIGKYRLLKYTKCKLANTVLLYIIQISLKYILILKYNSFFNECKKFSVSRK